MQYRSTVELAVGHGVGVEAVEAHGDTQRGIQLQTAAMPAAGGAAHRRPGA